MPEKGHTSSSKPLLNWVTCRQPVTLSWLFNPVTAGFAVVNVLFQCWSREFYTLSGFWLHNTLRVCSMHQYLEQYYIILLNLFKNQAVDCYIRFFFNGNLSSSDQIYTYILAFRNILTTERPTVCLRVHDLWEAAVRCEFSVLTQSIKTNGEE